MTTFDCFNGDADGICALTQLRRSTPLASTLVTGVKRDINLLATIVDQTQPGDQVIALDISLDKNRAALNTLLSKSVSVFYCDHHFAGEIPESDYLTHSINTAPETCTSMLINQQLEDRYLEWAIAGTFGDNLHKSASGLAKRADMNTAQLDTLQALGLYLNYNGYGASIEDLYFHPADLVQQTMQYDSALDFVSSNADTYQTLEQGYHDDMRRAESAEVIFANEQVKVILLEQGSWSRRVSGVFGNALANQNPATAHAVLSHGSDGHYVVSVRAPLANRHGADEVCRQFDTGGGRAAAAGINSLSANDLDRFVQLLAAQDA